MCNKCNNTKPCGCEETKLCGCTTKLDFKCLTNPCNNEINSLRDLLQVLINEVCSLKNQIENV